MLSLYLDEDFTRRGPRMTLPLALFLCLVLLVFMGVWFTR